MRVQRQGPDVFELRRVRMKGVKKILVWSVCVSLSGVAGCHVDDHSAVYEPIAVAEPTTQELVVPQANSPPSPPNALVTSCLAEDVPFRVYPKDNWKQDLLNDAQSNVKRQEPGMEGPSHHPFALVCAPASKVDCVPSQQLDANAFVRTVFGSVCQDTSGWHVTSVYEGAVCGPTRSTEDECCYMMQVEASTVCCGL